MKRLSDYRSATSLKLKPFFNVTSDHFKLLLKSSIAARLANLRASLSNSKASDRILRNIQAHISNNPEAYTKLSETRTLVQDRIAHTSTQINAKVSTKLASFPVALNRITGYTVVQECKDKVREYDERLKVAKQESERAKTEYEDVDDNTFI